MSTKPFDYQTVAGDYQYHAMLHGLPMQRFWHKGKLVFWDKVIAPRLGRVQTNTPIMEIGCGAGLLIQHLASSPQLKLGLDINLHALTFLQKRFKEMQKTDLFFPVCSTGEKLPFKENSFGGLILSEVLEHLHEPQLILMEAFRVLEPGGWCYLTTPNYRSFWPWMERILDTFRLTPPIAGAQHVSPFTIQTLRDQVKGWRVEMITSFYSASPFYAVFSEALAMRALNRECQSTSRRGMLLACLLRMPI
jgi:ubiquinone/menaquinone biosynthesis C-methylase UbiE